jgi:hypothetical protein
MLGWPAGWMVRIFYFELFFMLNAIFSVRLNLYLVVGF